MLYTTRHREDIRKLLLENYLGDEELTQVRTMEENASLEIRRKDLEELKAMGTNWVAWEGMRS